MSTSAQEPLAFTQAEREIISELLERERRDLPSEIHHTNSSTYRDQLRDRQQLLDRLLERLRHAA